MSLSGATGARTRWRLAKLCFLRLAKQEKQMAAVPYLDKGIWRVAEHAACSLKGCFGGSLKNRKLDNQKTEASLRCKLLNLFVTLGMPAFLWS